MFGNEPRETLSGNIEHPDGSTTIWSGGTLSAPQSSSAPTTPFLAPSISEFIPDSRTNQSNTWSDTSTASAAGISGCVILIGLLLGVGVLWWLVNPAQFAQHGPAIIIGGTVRVATTNGDRLLIRSAPGKTAAERTRIPAGTLLTVVGGPQTTDGGTWWEVTGWDAANTPGWASAQYLNALPPPTSTPVPPTVPAAAALNTVAPPAATPANTPSAAPPGIAVGAHVRTAGLDGSNMRIRATPGTGSRELKKVPEGTRLTVVGGPVATDGYQWWEVTGWDGDRRGWAAGKYLAPIP